MSNWIDGEIIVKMKNEIAALRCELAEAKGMIGAHERARDLMNKGFESTCELQAELKQEVRKLKSERDALRREVERLMKE